jgi:leader peptidase (prepilin peptidase)/N-methyltransferase
MPVDAAELFWIKGGLFTALLLIASAADIRKRTIPGAACLLIICTSFIQFDPAKLLGIFIALPFFIAALLSDGMGGGDVKLAASAGLVLGVSGGIAAVIIGLSAMLLFYAGYFIVQKLRGREREKSLPLAPFLSVGFLAAYLLNIGGNI